MKTVKKILDNKIFNITCTIIRVLFFGILTIYIAFICIQRITGNKSVLGYRVFTIRSGSMAGVYDINDVIYVKDYDPNKLKVGDDIVYLGNRNGFENKIITHRIIKIEESDSMGRVITTKGIKVEEPDPVITSDQVYGKVAGKLPVVNQINHLVNTQIGFFLLIFCPIVLFISIEVLQTITEIKIEKGELTKIK